MKLRPCLNYGCMVAWNPHRIVGNNIDLLRTNRDAGDATHETKITTDKAIPENPGSPKAFTDQSKSPFV